MPEVVVVDGPPPSDRPRKARAFVNRDVGRVTLLWFAILEPGEDLTEQVPQQVLSWDEWLTAHETYGLDVDGRPIGVA